MLGEQTIAEFLDALSSSAPTPSGGGASALVGALAASLGAMVANLTSGKRRYAEVQGRIDEIIPQLEGLRDRLLSLVDADAEAFGPLSLAYGLPHETEEERAHKAEVMEAALRGACTTPVRLMETLCEAIDLLAELAEIGTRIAISDVGIGAAFASAALRAASLNVLINAQSMTDRTYADALVARTQELLAEGCGEADATFEMVERNLRQSVEQGTG